MIQYTGTSVFDGVAVAPALRLQRKNVLSAATPGVLHPPPASPQQESQRFQRACKHVLQQLQRTYDRIVHDVGEKEAEIFLGQQALLEDPSFHSAFQKHLDVKHRAEFALQETLRSFEAKFQAMDIPLFRERIFDLQDVWSHVLAYLRTGTHHPSLHLTSPVVLVGKELLPSQLADLDWTHIKGIVTTHGGPSSHTAILASAMQIPYMYNVNQQGDIRDGQLIILDGPNELVLVNPSPELEQQYRTQLVTAQAYQEEQQARWHRTHPEGLGKQTACGTTLTLRANVSLLHDITDALAVRADGVGLFRTEIVYASRSQFPTEDDQTQLYTSVLKQMAPQPVTFRTFDLGGDKCMASYPPSTDSLSPMGWRGVRTLLDQPDLLRPQLRALLRASVAGSLRVMFPMLSTLHEWSQLQEHIQQCTADVQNEGHKIADSIEWGMMVETPSIALQIESIAPQVDFLSVGTNDLLQFLMAADRNNPRVNGLLKPSQPALLHLLQVIVQKAGLHCSVSLCGDMAAHPRYTPLLLGLGFRELSVPPKQLPALQQGLPSLHLADAETMAQEALSLPTSQAIEKMLREFERSL